MFSFGSSSVRDFSITVQRILTEFTVLETVIEVLHFLFRNLLDIFAPWPRKMGTQVDLPSFTRYVDGWLRFSRYILLCITYTAIVVAVNSPMRVVARSCMNVFGTSDSKHCRQQSLWYEWRRVSHCPLVWFWWRSPENPSRTREMLHMNTRALSSTKRCWQGWRGDRSVPPSFIAAKRPPKTRELKTNGKSNPFQGHQQRNHGRTILRMIATTSEASVGIPSKTPGRHGN